MSTHAHNAIESRVDPTRSKTLRREYARILRKPLRELKSLIWNGVVHRGSFDMAINEPLPVFRFESDEREAVADQFNDWLKSQNNQGLLDVVGERDNRFVRNGYTKGVRFSDARLRELGVDIPDEQMDVVLNKPVHEDKLRELYRRNLMLLDGITADMQREMRQALTEGLAEGINPRRSPKNSMVVSIVSASAGQIWSPGRRSSMPIRREP